jgi:hypothetical protein
MATHTIREVKSVRVDPSCEECKAIFFNVQRGKKKEDWCDWFFPFWASKVGRALRQVREKFGSTVL